MNANRHTMVGECDIRKRDELRAVLEQVFDECREGLRDELSPDDYEKRKQDFVFHMTDWRDNLEDLRQLFENPDQQDIDSATTMLIAFLSHVLPHLSTAGDLLIDGVPNGFRQPTAS